MFVLALLLLLVVAAVVAAILLAGTANTVRLDFDPINLVMETTPLVVFLIGVATAFALLFALALFRSASRRRLDQRRELKRLRQAEKDADHAGGHGAAEPRDQSHTSKGASGSTRSSGAANPGDATSSSDTMYADPDRR